MGLGDIIKDLVRKEEKEEKKEFKSPDVKFLEDDSTSVTHTIPIEVEPPSQKYIIKSGEEYLVFNSMEEMPPELREGLEHIDEASEFTHSYSIIVNGEHKNYSSLDEIPEDIRQKLGDKI